MTAIERTAYPRFKRVLSAKDLEEVYTPTPQERFLAHRSTKGAVAEAGFLVLLKTHQRLGRFLPLREVPVAILTHIARIVDPTLIAADLESYDSGTHGILAFFCAARMQHAELMVNESRRPSGRCGDAWLTRSHKMARSRLSARSLKGRSSTCTI